jgi:ubiquinone/menaquinone biosynthesis C-methylase UbiE
MSSPGCSPTVRKETLHTVSLVRPHLGPGTSVLDVGCGEGWVADEIARESAAEVATVDVVDIRRTQRLAFSLYDGVHLPFPDDRFDVVMLNFVLHHVPDDRKVALLGEALRVARRTVFILEDTPTTPLDRFVSRRHGEAYRRKIASDAPFGFLTPNEWRWLFRGMGIEAEATALGRFCRSVVQPFARAAFVLRKPARLAAVRNSTPAVDESSAAWPAVGG